jgi:hypothetical protein
MIDHVKSRHFKVAHPVRHAWQQQESPNPPGAGASGVSIFDLLAEQRILDAERRGEFLHLPSAGQPLIFDDDAMLSPEERMANKILKNAGLIPFINHW